VTPVGIVARVLVLALKATDLPEIVADQLRSQLIRVESDPLHYSGNTSALCQRSLAQNPPPDSKMPPLALHESWQRMATIGTTN
jgi:hypothetical protein